MNKLEEVKKILEDATEVIGIEHNYNKVAAQILNLVRDDMWKLTILGDKEIEVASQVAMFLPGGYLRGRKQVAQAQLEHNIDQLKEIIGET